jgi:hypothetical protein
MRGDMRPTFKKLEVRDLRDLETLISDNAESLEPGLRFIDASILLGHARIDLVGLDANDTLVLTALGFAGTEEMLLRVLEAYSWCLEYPETMRRLYPGANLARTPRVIFVAERLSDSFVRKVKHLNIPELDCLTFLHLEVNGEPAAYFESVERIRRAPAPLAVLQGAGSDYPTTLDQHPFIEGTPPEPAAQSRPVLEAERLAVASTDPIDPRLLGAGGGAREPQGGTAAGQKGEWQEFFDRLGTVQPPHNGQASRGIHEFLNQFGPAE